MGWWDESIYGGDAPLEWKENIYAFCKQKMYNKEDKERAMTKKSIEKNISGLRDMIDEVSKQNEDDGNIGYQILGAILMNSGYNFSENFGLKDRVLEAIENDEWAKENQLRKNALKNYKKIVKDYDFNKPFDIESINIFEDIEDDDEESIANEFKEVFGILNARIKKIESNIEEKSGNKEFDEGFATSAQEEIDFLTDFKELVARQEMMGVLLERISKGLISSSPSGVSNESVKVSSGASTDAGRADIQPG